MREPISSIGETVHEADGASRARFRAVGKWLSRVEYDPDQGNRSEDFQTSSSEYLKRFVVVNDVTNKERSVRVPGLGGPFIPGEIEGVILEPIVESHRWRPKRISNKAEFKAFSESDNGIRKRFMEQFGLDVDVDRTPGIDNLSLIDTEFVPLLAGPFYKQLYIYDYLYMHARAFNLVNHNALAASAVKQLARFTLGRGISFSIKNDEARGVWDEYWERNNMRTRLKQMARDLTWQGELLLRYYEKTGGYMTMRVLDASTCWEVVTDPEDIDHVYYYHFQWPTPYQIYGVGQIPVTKYIIQQVPPTNIQHIKINCSSQEKRGRSDLLPAMSWLKRFDDFYNGITLKQVLEANLVWKVKVQGDQADVDAFQSNPQLTQLPPPGGVWIENEAVNLEPLTAAMTASRGATGIGGEIASIVATSLNLPSEYFNIGGPAAARATALVRTDPAVKTIEDRQQLLRESLEEMYDRVISSALQAGRISRQAARHEPEERRDEEMTAVGSERDRAMLRSIGAVPSRIVRTPVR